MDLRQKNFFETSDAYYEALAAGGEEYFRDFLALVKKYVPGGAKVLDAGCGTGQSTYYLKQAGYKAQGVDGAERFVSAARSLFSDVDFRVGDLEHLEFPDKSFEAVACYNTLEHVTDVPRVLAEFLRITKNGGLVVIESPNLMSIKHVVDAFFRRSGETFEGVKNKRQLAAMFIRNIAWILKRTISSRADFKYRQPIYDYNYPDNDATVFLSPLDIRHCLESLGAKIISYQEVKHLPGAGVMKIVGSRFLGDHMGLIRIIARKGARYERQ